MNRSLLTLVAAFAAGCFTQQVPPPCAAGATTTGHGTPVNPAPGNGSAPADTIGYRDVLASHPGCTTAGLTYPPGNIPGYQCAAKAYAFPAGVAEDKGKPIVLLIHGNSDTPAEWERYPADTGEPMVAEQLVAAGFLTFAVDFRIDKNDDPQGNNDTENSARNIDHGWATPIAQHFVSSVMAAWPDRRIDLIGFSLGSTIVRDLLRRLHAAGLKPFERTQDVILLAGAHHGVSTYARLCGKNPTMRGRVSCELGNRDAYAPTDFLIPLNGQGGAWETPCADGDSAFGFSGACGGNAVTYTTVVMRDIADGSYQDEFVSSASSALAGADNHLIELSDTDESGYFFNGLLKNHYGASRSPAALKIIMAAVLK